MADLVEVVCAILKHKGIEPDDFGYVIIDECHHGAAETYKRILGHYKPEFTLGLTAQCCNQTALVLNISFLITAIGIAEYCIKTIMVLNYYSLWCLLLYLVGRYFKSITAFIQIKSSTFLVKKLSKGK